MEIWKIEKFCETASLEQLQETQTKLEHMIKAGRLTGTNAEIALKRVTESIALRALFDDL